MENIILNNGVEMPMLGLGVFRVENDNTGANAVIEAFKHGYRNIDTAAAYENEQMVASAIKESGLKREDVFITTKLSNTAQRETDAETAFAESLKNLATDYVDLYLIHWPVKEHYIKNWLALEKIYKSGRAKAIGISNFQAHHIQEIKKVWTVVPAINQIELHPRFSQKPLLAACKAEGIIPQSWSPLGGSKLWDFKEGLLTNEVLVKIGEKYNKSTAQVILRWNIDLGIVTIPKSATPSRIKENADIFDFKLTDDEIAEIDGLNQDIRIGPDPDNFNF